MREKLEMENQKNQIREIKPERDYVSRYADFPDPSSSLYITTTKQKNADDSENHLISGMRVVFKKDDVNGLFQKYYPKVKELPDHPSKKGTIRKLTICANELIIHGELWLPETNVYIFARKLVFKNHDGKPGRIITSHLPYVNKKAGQKENGEGEDGVDGIKAGNIKVYISDLEVDEPETIRFSLHGGNGQDAGPGTNGKDGISLDYQPVPGLVYKEGFDYWIFGTKWDSLTWNFNPMATYYHIERKMAGCYGVTSDSPTSFGQSAIVPTDGEDAKKPGRPGDGGDGAIFSVYFHLGPWKI